MYEVDLIAPELWEAVPLAVRPRIAVGIERIKQVRAEIGADARVKQMPRVWVQPAAWQTESGRRRQACAGIWPAERGSYRIGVTTAVGIAITEDARLVRSLLVHEFAHCFQIAKMIADHLDLGTALSFDGNPEDPEYERAMLCDPVDWFAPKDHELLRWRDPRVDPLDDELVRLVTAGSLPVCAPPGDFDVPKAHLPHIVPAEWTLHIRSLRKS